MLAILAGMSVRAKLAGGAGVASALALGTSEVSPLELVTAYVPFGNGGLGVQAHIIASVKRASGQPLYQRRSTGTGIPSTRAN